MRVRLTSDQLGPNPKFDRRKPVGDDNPVNRVVPAGTEIENPEALYLVINDQAEPIDEEANAAYTRYLQKRETALQAKQQRSGMRPALPLQAAPVPIPAPPAESAPVETPAPVSQESTSAPDPSILQPGALASSLKAPAQPG